MDLIDRQAAIDVLKNRWLKTRNYEGIGEDIAEECEIYLRTVPSIQFATDTNVGIKLGTNLAQLGTDCISRQAAIDALDEQITLCDKALGSFDISMKDEYAVKVERASLKAYRETLNVLPSAQPQRKTGRWTKAYDGNDDHVKCTGCFKTYDWISQAQYYNFCPNCGADMRGEQDEMQ